MFRYRLMLMLATVVVPASAFAQAPVDGAAVYEKSCASCHAAPAAGSRAPTREILSQNAPEAILTSLMSGKMYQQGGALTDAERRAVASFIAGRPLGTAPKLADTGRCTSKPAALSASAVADGWNGWGSTTANTRFVTAQRGGLAASVVPQLKLKWAFGFPGVSSARAQPAVAGGRLFVGSDSGAVFALDAKTGCTHWMFQAQHAHPHRHLDWPVQERHGLGHGRVLRRRGRGRLRR